MPDYQKKTVAELTEILKGRSLPHSGKKAELIARLNEADKAAAPSEGMRRFQSLLYHNNGSLQPLDRPVQGRTLLNSIQSLTTLFIVAPEPTTILETVTEAPAVAAEPPTSKPTSDGPPTAQITGKPRTVKLLPSSRSGVLTIALLCRNHLTRCPTPRTYVP
jgi:hypothetical protein